MSAGTGAICLISFLPGIFVEFRTPYARLGQPDPPKIDEEEEDEDKAGPIKAIFDAETAAKTKANAEASKAEESDDGKSIASERQDKVRLCICAHFSD